MRDYEKLVVWKKSHELTLAVYKVSESFPDIEKFGLMVHIRRTAASVPTNIAEGCGRDTQQEFYRFLSIASGSASELDYQLRLAVDLGYFVCERNEGCRDLCNHVRKMLNSLMQEVKGGNS